MVLLKNGGSALDAVEIAIKVLEDREITNAGYGSNLAIDGVVECDASIVDHYGRSGGVGAVAQIRNPISLARLVLEHTTQQLTLRRVPPNLLVAQGATDFAFEQGMPVLPHDALISPAARERWIRWKSDLRHAERKAREAEAKDRGYSLPSSSSSNRGTDPAPAHEEKARSRLRQEHTNALLASVWNEGQPVSPAPSAQDMSDSSSDPLMSLSRQSMAESSSSRSSPDESRPETPESEQEYIDPRGPPGMLAQSAKSPFIKSTQSLVSSPLQSASPDVTDGHGPSTLVPIDIEMSDVGAGRNRVGTNSRLHNRAYDGSSGSDTESTTTMLPSSPKQHPTPDVMSVVSEAAQAMPLPSTPPEHVQSPSPRATTPLRHVMENPPLPPPLTKRPDHITDTVGAIAIDCYGNIACGASSGGIGMKYRGRIGPAALVGVGAAVVPIDADDKDKTCVASVTSGTGEHMATTMAAAVCAERLYHGVQKARGGGFESAGDDEAIRSMIEKDFMGHPSVRNSNSAGAIGLLGVKKTRDGVYLYFAHNTDSFALASMHSDESRPVCTMSRNAGNGVVAQGGRAVRYKRRAKRGD
ncbi:nucleophile aminohydrolase [Cryomyces antarcticus]|uniref:N-terminal nucleophile aminohydrolase n=1 Tax=Cryomyces antarcticus TaxID=329879 RepID=A0ABR0M032_9PEZI|nr:hypothetical protein LTR39_000259 [Cryomyces antarcticus]KAK5021116.1 hypothetical protein LTR60_000115 [Cryomyces antarcticus]KAK5257522.1 hypothetical protein LTR16_000392 [Cryomyces antarcticus]